MFLLRTKVDDTHRLRVGMLDFVVESTLGASRSGWYTDDAAQFRGTFDDISCHWIRNMDGGGDGHLEVALARESRVARGVSASTSGRTSHARRGCGDLVVALVTGCVGGEARAQATRTPHAT